jgi:CRP-like cAMP-binding protein
MGDRVADPIEVLLNDKERPLRLRQELPRLLRYLGTPRAALILLSANPGDDPILRYRVAVALSHMRRHHEGIDFDRGRVHEAIGRRIEAYLHYLPMYRDLQQAYGDQAILVRALSDRLDQGMEIVFRLLGLVCPFRSMMNVFNRFVSSGARDRAYALELLENLVDEGTRSRVVPLLEKWHRLPGDDEAVAERAPARLMELAVSKDTVLRAFARHTAQRLGTGPKDLRMPEEGTVSENVVEKVFLLEGVSIFEKCGVDDLAALAAIAQERRFAAGALIYRENDPGDALYVVVEGKVLTEKDGQPIFHISEKECFGEVGLLDGSPRPVAARALEDTRALAIDRQDFLDLLSDRPELLQGLFAVLTRQMRQVLELATAQDPAAAKAKAK